MNDVDKELFIFDAKFALVCLVPTIVLLLVVSLVDGFSKKHEIISLKQQAISFGYAEYNPTNGVWQWKAEVK